MATDNLRTDAEWTTLCETVKKSIPSPIGTDAWVLVIAAALITSPKPEMLAEFYTYLSQNDPHYRSQNEREQLSLRLRDTLIKLITIVGAPQVLCALMPLAKAEGRPEEKAAESSLNPKWFVKMQSKHLFSDAISRQGIDVHRYRERGQKTIDAIYGPLLPKIFQSWGHHSSDFQFNFLFGVYGLYLSDNEMMSPLETEAVAFTSISCLGLGRPGLWHMRGMGRLLGARGSDDISDSVMKAKDMLRSLKVGVMAIVDWVGEEYAVRAKLDKWANVGDVLRELGGWGDDVLE